MAPEVGERLSALARDHAEGRMSLEAYRRLRGALLDGLAGIADESASVTTQPRARVVQPASAPLSERPQPSHDPPATNHVSRWRDLLSPAGGRARLAGLGGAVLVIALLAWHEVTRTRGPSPVTSSVVGPSTASAGPIQALLQPLIDDPDWSDSRLAALNDALLEAGRTRLAAARGADWYNAFVDRVRSRVMEQQALTGAPLSPDKSSLAALAMTLGIDLTAPDRPIRTGGAEASDRQIIDSRSREALRRDNRGR